MLHHLTDIWYQILIKDNYRITSHVAKKYKTLANSCGPLVDKAWQDLEDEFGEDQPILSSYVVGKKEFQKLQKEDMLRTLKEFTEMFRKNRSRCTESCMFLFLLIFYTTLFI